MSGKRVDNGVLGLLESELLRSIRKEDVRLACGMSRSADRLAGYVEALQGAAASCLRYSDLYNRLYVFDGRIWVPVGSRVEKDIEYRSLVSRAVRYVLKACSDSVSDGELLKGKGDLIGSLALGAASNKLGVSPSVIGFQNGVWDFADPLNPVRHSFNERLDITSVRGYEYAPGARCPQWESFLANAMSGADAETLQCFFGLGVKPRQTLGHSVEKMLWLVGNGSNGKSTCLDVLEYVYGEGLFSHASLPTLLDGNATNRMLGTVPVIGKRYNRCDEIQMSDITKKVDLLKRLCSADHVEFRRIGRDAVSSNDVPFLVFSMNRVPKAGGTDPALLRRLLIVRFGFSVRAEDMDTALSGRLCGEASGIWNWCVGGYRKLVQRGFLFPRTVDNEAEQRKLLLSSGQQMSVWLSDEGLSAQGRKRLQRPYKVPLSVLFGRYSAWCSDNDCEMDCENINVFGRVMAGGTKARAGLGFVKKRYAGGMYVEAYSDNKIDYGI